jgi:hypothetical protein
MTEMRDRKERTRYSTGMKEIKHFEMKDEDTKEVTPMNLNRNFPLG